jgi:hypothetical protein
MKVLAAIAFALGAAGAAEVEVQASGDQQAESFLDAIVLDEQTYLDEQAWVDGNDICQLYGKEAGRHPRVTKNIPCLPAQFGKETSSGMTIEKGEIVVPTPADGCKDMKCGEGGCANKILLVFRGVCPFYDKAVQAMRAGASGMQRARTRIPGFTLRLQVSSSPTVKRVRETS